MCQYPARVDWHNTYTYVNGKVVRGIVLQSFVALPKLFGGGDGAGNGSWRRRHRKWPRNSPFPFAFAYTRPWITATPFVPRSVSSSAAALNIYPKDFEPKLLPFWYFFIFPQPKRPNVRCVTTEKSRAFTAKINETAGNNWPRLMIVPYRSGWQVVGPNRREWRW